MFGKLVFIIALLVGFVLRLEGQVNVVTKEQLSTALEKSYQKSLQLIRNHEFAKAENTLLKILKKEPLFLEGQRELGLLYFRQKRFDEAIKPLVFSVNNDSLPSNSMLYTLGSSYWNTNNFGEVVVVLETLLQRENIGHKLYNESSKLYRDAIFSRDYTVDESQIVEIEKMSSHINTDWPEYLPVITADGNMLLFTRRNKGREDFYFSKKGGDGTWPQARPLTELNTPNNEGALCISADGKTIIFTICNDPRGFGSCDLYFSELFHGRWTAPRNLGSSVNTQYKETQPSLSPDGRTLYFVSDRPGGMGGHDIWMSRKDDKGEWQTPINLESPINTRDDELTPLMHFDGESLYFSSSGHPGFGSLDLFKSTLQSDRTWSTPLNLGSPINTKLDESSLAVQLSGNQAFMARESRDGSGNFSMNLYELTLTELTGAKPSSFARIKILDSITLAPLRAVIEVSSDDNNQNKPKYQADRDGEILLCLQNEKAYSILTYHPGYQLLSERFDLINEVGQIHTQEIEIKLKPIPTSEELAVQQGSIIENILKNVFFKTGSASLIPSSEFELLQLSSWMKAHPEIRIRIGGHTDDVGTKDANLLLSESRAKVVTDFLINTGISQSRLEYLGYGQEYPIAPNDTEDGRSKNRRTTFEIIP